MKLFGKWEIAKAAKPEVDNWSVEGTGFEVPESQNKGVPEDYVRVFENHIWVYNCVTALGRNGGEVPILVYKNTKEGEKSGYVQVEKTKVGSLFEMPNPFYSGVDLIEGLIQDLAINANAFVLKTKVNEDGPKMLFLLPASMVEIEGSKGKNWAEKYVYHPSPAQKIEYEPKDICHIRFMNPRSFTLGMSVMNPLTGTLISDFYAQAYNTQFFKKGAKPSGTVDMPPGMSGIAKDRFIKEFVQKYTGVLKQWGVMFLPSGAKFNPLAMPPKDMEYSILRKMNREEIIAAFGVPPILLGLLEYSSLRRNTRVLTPGGDAMLGDLKVGSEVLGFNYQTRLLEPHKVSAVMAPHEAELFRLETDTKRVELSNNHPMLVAKVGNPGRKAGGWDMMGYEYKHVDELSVGDILVVLDREPVVEVQYRVAEEEAYLIGLYLGDGCVFRDNRKGRSYRLYWGFPEGSRVRERVKELLEKVLGGYGYVSSGSKEYLASWGYREFVIKNEIEGTAKTKRIPRWVYAQSEGVRKAVLRGLLDSDGHVDKQGRTVWNLCNYELAMDIKILFETLGVWVSKVRQGKQGRSSYGDLLAVVQVTRAEEGMLVGSEDPLFQERWKNANLLKKKGHRRGVILSGHKLLGPEGHIRYERVRKVESMGVFEKVYDIEVEGVHNFVANGLVVSNSFANAYTQKQQFWESTMVPQLRKIEYAFNQHIVPWVGDSEDLWVEFDRVYIRSKSLDPQMSSTIDCNEVSRGIRTINEVRKARGDKEVKWGNVWWGSPGLIPIDSAEEQLLPTEPSEEVNPDNLPAELGAPVFGPGKPDPGKGAAGEGE